MAIRLVHKLECDVCLFRTLVTEKVLYLGWGNGPVVVAEDGHGAWYLVDGKVVCPHCAYAVMRADALQITSGVIIAAGNWKDQMNIERTGEDTDEKD